MRDIKFRAWDAKRGRMMQPFVSFVKHAADGLVNEQIDWHDDEDMVQGWDTSNQVNELLQYTGLKDKNGKEIYEGDVFNLGDIGIKYIVEWHDSGLRGRQYTNKSAVGLDHWQDQIEVIGNIYENPELVKK